MRFRSLPVRIAVLLILVGSAVAVFQLRARHRFDESRTAAADALARRDFNSASRHLNECLAREADADLILLAARTARRGSDFAAARKHLAEHERLQPHSTERRTEQRLLDLQTLADPATVRHRLRAATAQPWDAEASDTLEATVPLALKDLARGHAAGMSMVEGPAYAYRLEVDAAIARWAEHAANPADHAVAYYWRGRSRGLVHPREGVQDYRAALERLPGLSEARLHLADALLETDLVEAARHLEMLRKEADADPAIRLMLAQARRGLGQLDSARSCLDQLLAVSPDRATALLARGRLELDANRITEAIAFLERARTAAPNDPEVHRALSQANHMAGRAAESAAFQESYRKLETARLAAEEKQRDRERESWRSRVLEMGKGRRP
jgi:tetratricopeptide (TPR) repeat protein